LLACGVHRAPLSFLRTSSPAPRLFYPAPGACEYARNEEFTQAIVPLTLADAAELTIIVY